MTQVDNRPWPWFIWALLFAGVAGGLLVWRWEILHSPPYWDYALGLWTEAAFLVETDFDYLRLWHDEKPIWQGGARCYVTSVFPTLVALLLVATGSAATAIVVYHVFTICTAALLLLLLFALLRSVLPTLSAALVGGVVLTTPLFSAQVDMLGMELPLATCGLLAAWTIHKQKYALAALPAWAAFAIKATGILYTAAALATTFALLFVADRGDRRRGRLTIGCGLLLLSMVAQWAVVEWGGHVQSQLDTAHRARDAGLVMAWYWSGDLVVLAGVAAVFGVILLSQHVRTLLAVETDVVSWRRCKNVLRKLVEPHGLPLFSLLFIAAALLAITRLIYLPRYLVSTIPFLWILLSAQIAVAQRMRALAVVAIVGMIAFNLANQYGRFYPDVAAVHGTELARSGAVLERSREYLAEHRANLDAVRTLEELQPDAPIFAATPYAHFMALPQLGYVQRPLSGYGLNGFSETFPAFRDVSVAALESQPEEAIFVSVGNTFAEFTSHFAMPRHTQGDEILYDDSDEQPSPLVIFRQRVADSVISRRAREDWYLDRLWLDTDWALRARVLVDYLLWQDRADRALTELERGLSVAPGDPELRAVHVRLLLDDASLVEAVVSALLGTRASQWSGAIEDRTEQYSKFTVPPRHLPDPLAQLRERQEHMERLIQADPGNAAAHFELGLARLATFQLGLARESFGACTSLSPGHVEAQVCLSLMDLMEGRYNVAAERLAGAAEIAPENDDIALAQGFRAMLSGEVERAEEFFTLAADGEPRFANCYAAALLEARRENRQAAERWIDTAQSLRPSSKRPGALRRLLARYSPAEVD